MSEEDLQKLMAYFDRIDRECDTPEKATALLQSEGILDENGDPAESFREPSEVAWR